MSKFPMSKFPKFPMSKVKSNPAEQEEAYKPLNIAKTQKDKSEKYIKRKGLTKR